MFIGAGNQLKWKGKLIGYWHETERGVVLIMPRKAEHLFRMYTSWGINAEILKELASTLAVVGMRIIVDGGKRVLITTPSKWLRLGIPYQARGEEPQMQLRETDFDQVFG